MPKDAITRFSSLEVDPLPGGSINAFYPPTLWNEERDTINPDDLKGGALIFNTDQNTIQTYAQDIWNSLASYRSGAITDIGDIANGNNPNLTCTGAIISASKADPADNGSLITINYADLGYIPFIFISIIDSSVSKMAQLVIRPNHTASQAVFFLEEIDPEIQNVQAQIMLLQPNL